MDSAADRVTAVTRGKIFTSARKSLHWTGII